MVDYHDYVIKDGKFIGKFEEMYQDCENVWNKGEQKLQYDILLAVIDYEPKSILDIGCGLGSFTKRLQDNFPSAKVKGVDISKTAIKKAKNSYPKIDFEELDIMKKPIEGKYDLIIVSQVFWYVLPKIKEIIKNIKESSENIIILQQFYQPGEQKYGNEIMTKPEDLIKLVNLPVKKFVEINRNKDYNAIISYEL